MEWPHRTYREKRGPRNFRKWEKEITAELQKRAIHGYLKEEPEVITMRKMEEHKLYNRSRGSSVSREDEQEELDEIRRRSKVNSDVAYQSIVDTWNSIDDEIPPDIVAEKNPFALFSWLKGLFDEDRETDRRAVLWSRLVDTRTEPGQHPGQALYGVQAIIQALRETTHTNMTVHQFLSMIEPIAMMQTLSEEYNAAIPRLLQDYEEVTSADVMAEAHTVWNQDIAARTESDYAAERLRIQAAKRKRED